MSFTKKSFSEIRDNILDDLEDKGLITDRNVGGVARTLVEAYSRELALLYEELQHVSDSAFVDSATGSSLDFLVSILNINRISGEQAVGKVIFSRGTPAPGDITIPKGTIITHLRKTAGVQSPLFETLEAVTLLQGENRIEASVRAQEQGEGGEVPAAVLNILPRPIVGIEEVINEEPTVLRGREESDEELRERAKNALQNTGKATEDAIEFAIRELGVDSVRIVDRPNGSVGEIEALIDGENLDGNKKAIEDTINQVKAAGIFANFQIVKRIDIMLVLKLTLDDPALLDEEEQTDIERNVRTAIHNYISSLDVGEVVRKNGIISAALNIPQILDVEILDYRGIRSRILNNGDILIEQNERAIVVVENIELILKEKKFQVFIDLEHENLHLRPTVTGQGITVDTLLKSLRTSLQAFLAKELTEESEDKQTLYYDKFKAGLLQALKDVLPGFKTEEENLSGLKIILLHSFDGFVNTMERTEDKDVIRTDEIAELRKLSLNISIIKKSTGQ